jgi:hypothetical protein
MPHFITLSARNKHPTMPVSRFLAENFGSVNLQVVDSIFGFNAPCKMYGGRQFVLPELSDLDLKWMYDNGIGYRIPLSNILIDDQMYDEGRKFLQKHHRSGNSVILVSDDIALKIRNDFPLYSIECSVIKAVNTKEKVEAALEIFDTVVPLPEAFNTDFELLKSFPKEVKDRIRLFLTIGCSYHCPGRVCYGSFSRMNRGDIDAKFECAQMEHKKNFVPSGMVDFDMENYLDLGFSKFKMLRVKPSVIPTGF